MIMNGSRLPFSLLATDKSYNIGIMSAYLLISDARAMRTIRELCYMGAVVWVCGLAPEKHCI